MNCAEPLSIDVVRIIDFAKRSETEATSVAAAKESLRDIQTKLQHLLSSILTAPLTGRMFVPMPTSLSDGEASVRSVAAQLRY